MKRIIGIKGAEFYAFHGYYEEERKIGGYYQVDVEITLPESAENTNDDLGKTFNYEVLYQIVSKEMQISSQLLEHIAERIVNLTLLIEPYLKYKIRITKKNPPMKGKIESTYIELTNY
jgi:dihydroneopterin aldolase